MFRIAPQQMESAAKIFCGAMLLAKRQRAAGARDHRSHLGCDQFVWSCNGLIFRIMFARNRILAAPDRIALAFGGTRAEGKTQNPDDRGAECSDALSRFLRLID
jgi:hypothetical protein